jgi:hypothetical protein
MTENQLKKKQKPMFPEFSPENQVLSILSVLMEEIDAIYNGPNRSFCLNAQNSHLRLTIEDVRLDLSMDMFSHNAHALINNMDNSLYPGTIGSRIYPVNHCVGKLMEVCQHALNSNPTAINVEELKNDLNKLVVEVGNRRSHILDTENAMELWLKSYHHHHHYDGEQQMTTMKTGVYDYYVFTNKSPIKDLYVPNIYNEEDLQVVIQTLSSMKWNEYVSLFDMKTVVLDDLNSTYGHVDSFVTESFPPTSVYIQLIEILGSWHDENSELSVMTNQKKVKTTRVKTDRGVDFVVLLLETEIEIPIDAEVKIEILSGDMKADNSETSRLLELTVKNIVQSTQETHLTFKGCKLEHEYQFSKIQVTQKPRFSSLLN